MFRVATVREKVWKMKFFLGQGKVREFGFESGKIAKSASQGISKFSQKRWSLAIKMVLKEFEKSELVSPQVFQNFLIKLKSLNILFEKYMIFPFYSG